MSENDGVILSSMSHPSNPNSLEEIELPAPEGEHFIFNSGPIEDTPAVILVEVEKCLARMASLKGTWSYTRYPLSIERIMDFYSGRIMARVKCRVSGISKPTTSELDEQFLKHEYNPYNSFCKWCGVPMFAVVDEMVTEECSQRLVGESHNHYLTTVTSPPVETPAASSSPPDPPSPLP